MKFLGILFKAIFRFFKKNIISVISMVFLLLFSSTIFTTLNNTVKTLNSSYSKITKEGNLHDFVVNENYRTSSWTAKFKVVDSSNNKIDYTNSIVIDKINEVWIKPDAKTWEDGSKLLLDTYNEWEKNGKKTDNSNYILFSQNSDLLSGIKLTWTEGVPSKDKVKEINSRTNNFRTRLNNIATDFLTKNFVNDIEKLGTIARQFNSLEITQSRQGKFFKIIKQEYNELIDKIVIYDGQGFSPINNDFSGYQNEYVSLINEFNSNNWKVDDVPTVALPNLTLDQTIKKYNEYKKIIRLYGLNFINQLSEASWSDNKWNEEYSNFYSYLISNNFDPYFSKLPGTILKPSLYKDVQENFKKIIDNNLFYDKGYQITVNITGTSPITATLTNKRSYEAIVSPQYLKDNNKECLDYNEWQKHINTPEDDFNRWLSKLPDKNKLQIDNDEYVILGSGMSPDFMYPIVSLSKPLPNTKNEVLVYLNSDGFSRVHNTYRNATSENMLYGKFLSSVKNQNEVINKINDISRQYMSWPSNMKSTYMFNNISNTVTPSPQRLVFIPKIVKSVNLISSLLLIFITICMLIITFILIKRFIDVNKIDLGILLANGYKKWNVLLPLTILFLSFILIGNIVGYVLGFAFQGIAMSLFSNFWTIPSYAITFNWIPFITFILLGTLLFFGIIWLTSLFILKGDATLLIDNTSANKVNRFSILMKKIFRDKNPLSQLRYSIAFSSIFKLLTLTIMGAFITVALTFGFASNNKFNESKEKTFAARQYEYAIDLVTPTLQGGQYFTVPYNQIGMSLYGLENWNKESNENYQLGQYINEVGPYSIDGIKNTATSPDAYVNNHLIDKDQLVNRGYSDSKNPKDFTNLITQQGNFMLPSLADGLGPLANTNEVNYLQHLVQSKLLLNATMGTSFTGFSKLWDIGVKLMPSNQKNYCDDANNQILSKISGDVKNGFEIDKKGYYTFRQYLMPYVLPATEDDYLNNNVDKDVFVNQGYGLDIVGYGWDNKKNPVKTEYPKLNVPYWKINIDRLGGSSSLARTKLDTEYIMLMLNAFELPEYASINYLMSYNKIPVLNGDKTYSYAMFNINNFDVPLSEQKIIGISNSNKSFLNLKNDNGDDLEKTLINSKIIDNTVPIIINKSFAKRSGLNIGDKFNVSINNTIDSYTKGNELFSIWKTPIGKRIKSSTELRKLIVDENNKEDSLDYIKNNYDFKVIDILDTYEGNEIYTSQDNVNIITGLKVFDTRNEKNKFTGKIIGENGVPFNGIYTNSSNPYQISNSSSFYSLSGINPGNDQLLSGVTSVLKYGKRNITEVRSILGYTENIDTNDINSFANTLVSVFGQSSYVTIVSRVTPTNIIEESFDVMNDTLITIQYVLISIILIVSFIIIILLTFVIVNDALKISLSLKALGLSDIKNVLSLLAIYIPVVLFGILIAIPLAILFCSWYTNFIFDFSGILLNIIVQWWHVILSSMLIVIVFILASLLMLYKLSKKNLANEIK